MHADLAILNSFTAACSLVAAVAGLLLTIYNAQIWQLAEVTRWQR
jgi:hypothetical protein